MNISTWERPAGAAPRSANTDKSNNEAANPRGTRGTRLPQADRATCQLSPMQIARRWEAVTPLSPVTACWPRELLIFTNEIPGWASLLIRKAPLSATPKSAQSPLAYGSGNRFSVLGIGRETAWVLRASGNLCGVALVCGLAFMLWRFRVAVQRGGTCDLKH